MRIRTLKPEFWSSEAIAAIPRETRLTFIGLWSYVDDNGVGRDNPRLIVAALFPLEADPLETLATVSRDLATLAKLGRITRYSVGGRSYLAVRNWDEHQKIDKPGKSRYPEPSCADAVVKGGDEDAKPGAPENSRDSRETPAPVVRSKEQGVRSKEQGTGEQGKSVSAGADAPPAKVTALIPSARPSIEHSEAPTAAVWLAYASAYKHRWGAEPVRNKVINGQLANFIARIPREEAPLVASHYVGNNRALYVQAKHPVGLLLRDAEPLHTEWVTGRSVTETEARQTDRTQSNLDAVNAVLAEIRGQP